MIRGVNSVTRMNMFIKKPTNGDKRTVKFRPGKVAEEPIHLLATSNQNSMDARDRTPSMHSDRSLSRDLGGTNNSFNEIVEKRRNNTMAADQRIIRRQIMRRGSLNLEEYNYGLTLEKLATDPKEWHRLRQFLLKSKGDMETCIVDGTTPLFGYPTVCFSPQALQQDRHNIKAAKGTD